MIQINQCAYIIRKKTIDLIISIKSINLKITNNCDDILEITGIFGNSCSPSNLTSEFNNPNGIDYYLDTSQNNPTQLIHYGIPKNNSASASAPTVNFPFAFFGTCDNGSFVYEADYNESGLTLIKNTNQDCEFSPNGICSVSATGDNTYTIICECED